MNREGTDARSRHPHDGHPATRHVGDRGAQDVRTFLTDPDLNADWTTYSSDEALQSRYAVLGAMGPDIFYAMLDYGGEIQEFEDTVLKIAGTFRCVGQLSSQLNNIVDSTLNDFTDDVWEDVQTVFAQGQAAS